MTSRQRRGLVADVERYIRREIMDGQLASGSRLQQDQIAEALQMSVTPVREAFVALAASGWLVLEPNRGAFVRPITRESVGEFAELSTFLMEFIIRRAVKHGTPDDFARLDAMAKELSDKNHPDDIWEGIRDLNLCLCEIGRVTWVRSMLRRIGSFILDSIFELRPESVGASHAALLEMTEEISRGNADKAVALSREYTLSHLNVLLEYLAEHGSLSEDGTIDGRFRAPRR